MENRIICPMSKSPEDIKMFTSEMFVAKSSVIPKEYVSNKPSIMNQLNSSMCVAFALAYLKELQEFKERGVRQKFSPAYIYGIRDGWFNGEGMYSINALKDLRKFGICKLEEFPIISDFPTIKSALESRLKLLAPYSIGNAIQSYYRIKTVEDGKRAIIEDEGFLIGTHIFQSFFRPTNGIIPYVKDGEKNHGGHGMLVYGWKVINGKEYWIVANSWGEAWGDGGVCYIPTDYPQIYEMFGATDRPLRLNESKKLILVVGDVGARVLTNDSNAQYYELDTPPQIVNGRTMVPIGLVSKLLGYKVEWIPEYKTIIIEEE